MRLVKIIIGLLFLIILITGCESISQYQCDIHLDDDKMLTMNVKIPMLDVSGFIDHMYRQMNGKWPRSRE